jgi:hypothetical protein
MSEYDLGDALYKIKRAAGLRGADSVTIWSNGDVSYDDDAIGNLHDEI